MSNLTASTFDDLPDSAFIRQRELLKIVPFSSATLWRKVKVGDFPKPVKFSFRITAFNVGAVRQFLLMRSVGGAQ